MTVITTRFDHDSTAAEVTRGVDLRGRTALVTGGASGIGAEISRALANAGAQVTVAVRDVARARADIERIDASIDGPPLRAIQLDLSDLTSVDAAVAAWNGPLDLLIGNAGVMATPELRRSVDGHELQFATNHLGHFALAVGLHDALASADHARVVIVSSSAHTQAPVDLEDVDFDHSDYNPWIAYGRSKTANVLFAVEAWRRWERDGITVNAVMPGGIMTELQRNIPSGTRSEWARMPNNKTPEQGAAASLIAAVAPEFHLAGGRYIDDGDEAEVISDHAEVVDVGLPVGVRRWALDPATATRLWDLSLDLLHRSRATRSSR